MNITIEKEYHPTIHEKLDGFLREKSVPHILFYGEHGCGKKTIVQHLLNEMYKNMSHIDRREYVLYVDCAFGKGIKFIRDEVKFFAKKNVFYNQDPICKTIVLLNCELLTIDAQSALRRCIEVFSNSTRFFVIVQKRELLLRPIVSRFCCIHVPRPMIKYNPSNIHTVCRQKHISKFLKDQKHSKQKYMKKQLQQLDVIYPEFKSKQTSNETKQRLIEIARKNKEKGITYLDYEAYLKKSCFDNGKEGYVLIAMEKTKQDCRNEELLMYLFFELYIIRRNLGLKNIYEM